MPSENRSNRVKFETLVRNAINLLENRLLKPDVLTGNLLYSEIDRFIASIVGMPEDLQSSAEFPER